MNLTKFEMGILGMFAIIDLIATCILVWCYDTTTLSISELLVLILKIETTVFLIMCKIALIIFCQITIIKKIKTIRNR